MHLLRTAAVRTAAVFLLFFTVMPGGAQAPPAQGVPASGNSATPAKAAASVPAASKKVKAMKPADVCGLLTAADLKKVHAIKVEEMKPSRQNASTIEMWQCYYRAPVISESVHLMLGKPGKDPLSARAFWKETITRAAQSPAPQQAPASKAEVKQVRHHPQKVEGVGEEAWWIGDRKAGALYVLQGEQFFRISIGGAADEGQKREQSKQLAHLVLKRIAKT